MKEYYFQHTYMCSEASPSVGLDVLTLGCIACELNEHFFWLAKILPWALWANVDAAQGIG